MAAPHTLHTPAAAVQWLRSHATGTLQTDSRLVQAGDAFIAWPGGVTDGRAHAAAALAQGAACCLVESEGVEAFRFDGAARVAAYPQLKAACGPIAAAWFQEPSRAFDVIAVTGTNGKTSTAWWVAQAITALSKKELAGQSRCGLVGTLGMGEPGALEPTGLTTPDPVRLQRGFRAMADAGFAACAIEASSVGIVEHRLDATCIHTAVFTNFTQDHLDYHGSMEAYWQAKAQLFAWPGLRAAVVNVDDGHGETLARRLADAPVGRAIDLWTVSLYGNARIVARGVRRNAGGLACTVEEGAEHHALATRLIGDYNLSNLLGVIGALRARGVPLADAVAVCATLAPVPGRMECIARDGAPLVAVDYAHTPDAIEKALAGLRPMARERGGRLWCVFGCGGDRDPAKRPLMGAAAVAGADRVVVTSDNPRSERPQAIIDAILDGIAGTPGAAERVQAEPDRALAIALAVAGAEPQDVVLVAGKGHETYQEADGVRTAFSDQAEVRKALEARA